MLRYIKWGFWGLLSLTVFLFLHYTLLQHDVVKITNTYSRLTTVGANRMFYSSPDVGTGEADTRDIRFIETVRENGKVAVYRNEDTGWVWPPYFKYDSSNLQAEASNLKTTEAAPKWAVVTHYGWRIAWMSIYPNAVAVRAVEGPDVQIIPWVNIIILATLAFILLMLRRMWMQFRERTVDPLLVDAAETWDAVDDRADAARDKAVGLWSRFLNWLGTWRGKPGR